MRISTAVITAIAVLVCTAASARPPEAQPVAGTGKPIVGKVRMRDRVVPLTQASLAEGGAARELNRAFAEELMADIDHEHRNADDDRGSR